MEIKKVSYETIYPIWKNKLWKDRVSKIEKSNSIIYLGGHNPKLMMNEPICLACYDGKEIIGVNSLLPTTKFLLCRSRGLYVNKEQRRKGIGKALIEETIKHAKDFEYIWSMPRQSALQFYLSLGFKQTSKFYDHYEFGPNCFVIKKI